MATVVRSYSKINLGLAIGTQRADGFHSLLTLYQTLALHDRVTVSAVPAPETSITITSNDVRVPKDSRNTAWKIVSLVLAHLGLHASVSVDIQKRLPIQGGMGAGSANAAAALLGLERELGRELPPADRVQLASSVGSDVPLFLLGGTVLGTDRGQKVQPFPDLQLGGSSEIACVVALPEVGVSTPAAFRIWDEQFATPAPGETSGSLQSSPARDNIEKLSRTYSSVFHQEAHFGGSGASGIISDPGSTSDIQSNQDDPEWSSPEKLHGLSREQLHTHSKDEIQSGIEDDLAENSLLALVRTGIENDFEQVVFLQHPSLREIKRQLMGSSADGNSAIYAALSGSGSALFGLYRSPADAQAAQQRVQQHGVRAIVTSTMPRQLYWSRMFAG